MHIARRTRAHTYTTKINMPSWRTGNRNLPPKEQGGPPAKFFHPGMMALFTPDQPLEFVAPPGREKRFEDDGLAKYMDHFESGPPPPRVNDETPKQRRERLRFEKQKKRAAEIEENLKKYEEEKEKIKGDAYKTLFVGRLSYDVDERKLQREFDRFGPIHSVTMIEDRSGNPRGYAFIQYESEKDMREALRKMDGVKISGRRIVVDVERGRTTRDWKPRRLGGGLGDTRKTRPKKLPSENNNGNRFNSGRERRFEERRQDRYRDDRGRDRRRYEDRYSRGGSRGRDDRYSRGEGRRRYRSRSRSRERSRFNSSERYGDRRGGGYRRR